MNVTELQAEVARIHQALPAKPVGADKDVVDHVVAQVDRGELRTADRVDGRWQVLHWVKQGLDIYFRTQEITASTTGSFPVRDKFPLKQNADEWDFRIAPVGSVRYGAYIGPAATIMPAYVNIGAWIGPNTLIDTWVSIGTCCQIGAGVTILPGASVIGSLYPLDSIPAIIEDGCYIGSNCVIGSGVLVSEGAYLDSGVVVTRSTPIVDLTTDKVELTTGLIPANAIVAAGTWSLRGSVSVAAALVTGYREPPMSPSVSLGESIAQRLAAVDHR